MEEGQQQHLVQGKTARWCYRVLMFIAGLMSSVTVCRAVYGFANWQQTAAGGL